MISKIKTFRFFRPHQSFPTFYDPSQRIMTTNTTHITLPPSFYTETHNCGSKIIHLTHQTQRWSNCTHESLFTISHIQNIFSVAGCLPTSSLNKLSEQFFDIYYCSIALNTLCNDLIWPHTMDSYEHYSIIARGNFGWVVHISELSTESTFTLKVL